MIAVSWQWSLSGRERSRRLIYMDWGTGTLCSSSCTCRAASRGRGQKQHVWRCWFQTGRSWCSRRGLRVGGGCRPQQRKASFVTFGLSSCRTLQGLCFLIWRKQEEYTQREKFIRRHHAVTLHHTSFTFQCKVFKVNSKQKDRTHWQWSSSLKASKKTSHRLVPWRFPVQ